MNEDDDVIRAIHGRDDPVPAVLAPGARRACICVDVRDEDVVTRIERWMVAHVDQLTCVRSTGCGCCVIGWDIEGPQHVIDTLPAEAVGAFSWPSDELPPTPRRFWWARRPWRR